MTLLNVIELSETLCAKPIKAHLKYATPQNFVGRVVEGYVAGITDIALLTPKAAHDLCNVQNELLAQGYALLIYDAYRPKRAVMDFVVWSKQPPASEFELERKAKHYPNIEKSQLFELGYIMEDSNHCYGNTVDVVLMDARDDKPLEMGARFDFMDVRSHVSANADEIGEAACRHRKLLADAMMKFDFEPYPYEFWHFTHGGKAGREVAVPFDVIIGR